MKIRDFALLALFIALVAVSTMIIRVPIPQTNGYMNLGDSMVLLSALFFGPVGGFIAGGIGSALADILGGYPQWALWTLFIKGIEALLIIAAMSILGARKDRVSFRLVIGFIAATAWMVLGYFIAESIMYDQKAALAEVPANILQALGSVVLATLLLPVFHRIISATRD
ncbi:MAG TPA: ECF transporter S component [Deltaproteobacteria bacterium]|nr:ECF transporter S component [Deltaproteobacteria bacterium]HQI02264.1 ECF transporter S component [Deltaproteobacteria bacterium]HQJ07408.1 ECF transporter S component [Deltaproteobacteria bacterium]